MIVRLFFVVTHPTQMTSLGGSGYRQRMNACSIRRDDRFEDMDGACRLRIPGLVTSAGEQASVGEPVFNVDPRQTLKAAARAMVTGNLAIDKSALSLFTACDMRIKRAFMKDIS